MTNKPTGGDAFPSSIAATPGGDTYQPYPGMTLRDWFAGQVLAGINASKGMSREETYDTALSRVRNAYQQADAMIKERDK